MIQEERERFWKALGAEERHKTIFGYEGQGERLFWFCAEEQVSWEKYDPSKRGMATFWRDPFSSSLERLLDLLKQKVEPHGICLQSTPHGSRVLRLMPIPLKKDLREEFIIPQGAWSLNDTQAVIAAICALVGLEVEG